MKNKRRVNLLLGPFVFLLILFAVPDSLFVFNHRVALGTIVWMATWWITAPVGVGVTGLVPLAVNALFNIIPMNSLIGNYMNATCLLLFASDIVSVTWHETGLDKRIALKCLCLFGTSVPAQLTAWLLVSAVLSAFLPNMTVCALLLPIASAMLAQSGHKDVGNSNLAMLILSTIAWGAGMGGMGTPLGGSMNLIGVNWFEDISGHEFSYVDWTVRVLPIMVVMIIVEIVILCIIRPKQEKLEGSKEFFKEQYKQLGKMSKDETLALILFGAPAVLAFARPLYADFLPAAANAYIFTIFALLSFCLTKSDGTPMNTWEKTEKELSWSIIWLVGGAMAVGSMMITSGVTDRIAEFISAANLAPGFPTMFLFTAACLLFAEFCSNSAAATIILPIIYSVCNATGQNPVPYMYVIICAYNTAFIMPTAIRAQAVAYGVKPAFMMKNGLVQTIAALVIISVLGTLMMSLFPAWMSVI